MRVRLPRRLHDWSRDPRTSEQRAQELAQAIARAEAPLIADYQRRVAANLERRQRERLQAARLAALKVPIFLRRQAQ